MNVLSVLVSVASVWGIAVITTGPNFVVVVQAAMRESRRAALSSVLGICVGTCLWACAGFFGLAVVFRMAPWTYLGVKLCGGSYLIYLGLQRLNSSTRPVATSCHGISADMASHGLNFRRGLFTNLSNPKTAMFITSVFAATLPSNTSISLGMMSVGLMCSLSLLWYAGVAYVFSLHHCRAMYQSIHRWIDRCAGILFLSFGVKLVTTQ
jgi:RhtB (resistance to homoserine/threonine) family protein